MEKIYEDVHRLLWLSVARQIVVEGKFETREDLRDFNPCVLRSFGIYALNSCFLCELYEFCEDCPYYIWCDIFVDMNKYLQYECALRWAYFGRTENYDEWFIEGTKDIANLLKISSVYSTEIQKKLGTLHDIVSRSNLVASNKSDLMLIIERMENNAKTQE